MWSRNGRPVATWMRPRPPIWTFAVSCVSLLLRVTDAFLLKPNLHGMGMRAQPFEVGQSHGSVAKLFEIAALNTKDARPFQERVHAERRGKTRSAAGRQGVVGSRGVIPQRHR